jgi:predicted RNA-binding Zn-ribbon protein involved in translation (DUF1610 family)
MNDYSELRGMTDVELIHTVAFYLADYVEAARQLMNRMLIERGYNENTVKDWRHTHLTVKTIDMICEKCQVELELDEYDLIAGEFHCPECGHPQIVNYDGALIRD